MSATATPRATPALGPGMQPGRHIGKYEILRHVATGGMAELYLARASGLENFEKLVALKRILPSAAGDPESIQMLLDEARISATLHHSNIVQTFDIGQADGEYFICMEYLHGRNVATISKALELRGLRFDEDSAMTIVLGVCAGLQYAHDKTDEQGQPRGIVHRDVSPHNVIVTHDGGVKLVDFGLVKAENRAHASRSGALKGKLAYMSPEQCRARPVDRRADVFALSIMLWELTTGEPLYVGECDYDYLCAILEHDARSPRTIVPDYPSALEAIVMKGLAREPAARWASVEEMQLQLEDYCRDRKLRISPITLRKTMEELFGEELARPSSEMTAVDLASTSFGRGSADARSGSRPARPARTSREYSGVTRPRRWPVLAGIGAIAIAAAIAIVVISSGGSQQPITGPEPPRTAAPKPEPTPPRAIVEVRPAAPAPAAEPKPPPAPSAPTPRPSAPKATAKPVATPAKPAKPARDRESLFPE